MTDSVRIVEVGPRDGLQNEKTPVSIADRVAFVEALIGAGLNPIEVGAFVSPKAIPQLAGSAVAPMRPAAPAMSQGKTSSTCSKAWGLEPASTWASWWLQPTRSVS
jgi:isopropylmalate/homocitrate/citramalate synthase